MDYRNLYNIYPNYYFPPYQDTGHQYQQPQIHHASQQQQQQLFSQHNVSGPLRNFNNSNSAVVQPIHAQNRQFSQQQHHHHQQWTQQYSQPYVQHSQSQQCSNYSSPYVPNFLMTSGSGLTPTLTPTTLATIEQSFLELQSGHPSKVWDSVPQSGFMPPVVDPGHSTEVSQDSQDYSSEYSDTEWEPKSKKIRVSHVMKDIKNVDLIVTSTGTYNAAPQRKYNRRSKDEKLPPEEEERRKVRRERNKLAAAKCRQRRVDQTNTLVEETERLEAEQSQLESEIQSLQQEKDQLEFILQAHQPLCKFEKSGVRLTKFKVEPGTRLHKCENHSQTSIDSTPENLSMSASISSVPTMISSQEALELSSLSSRPNSLPFIKRDHSRILSVTSATGITINTPSSGMTITPSSMFCPGLDSMMDGSTGLTPLTGISCSSQVQRNSSDGGSETVGSPSLVSL